MKVFPEYFDFNQFEMARENMHTIKRPYIWFGGTLNFNFQEYNSNIKLQCVHWHRMIKACVNTYGYFDFLKNIRCLEATEYFKQCIQLNGFFAYHKKYYPQEYYHSEYWRVSPHYDNVFVDADWEKRSEEKTRFEHPWDFHNKTDTNVTIKHLTYLIKGLKT